MTTEGTIKFLFDLEKFGMKMDLQNIRRLMEFAGDPDKRLKVVHVAGTNGKGSTCAAIASVLTSMKYKVGLYTSPHIVDFSERIRIDGTQISDPDIAGLVEYFEPEIINTRATFFEASTAMMFKYFADNRVDYAVIETGLGGRLDSTNIVDPLVSIITNIGLDHTQILGDTLEKIAREKAGIIKQDRPAIVNVGTDSVKEVFYSIAGKNSSELFFVDEVAQYENPTMDLHSSTIDVEVLGNHYPGLKIGLSGEHQVQNALTALTALQVMRQHGITINREKVYEGFEFISDNTGHRGRLEIISNDPLVILDVAHNPDGVRSLMDSLGPLGGKKGILLFAAMKDKDVKSMLSLLQQRFGSVILTQLRTSRSLTVSELKKLSEDIKLQSQIFDNSSEALRAALTQINNDGFLLVTGSHYLGGEILPLIEKTSLNIQCLTSGQA
ncbi:MAG TPA: folylpolyglutamate synthase/dihydrofolate synthase family protein [Candidatus Acidoferrales bacterium]|nr:folylpolyglutamate synthase/dihydrofolate synthase family protein [Candidatus Acidoferrales bacterium]